MTRVRLTHTAREGEFELVEFTERWPVERNQTWVLRDDAGEQVTLEHYSAHDGEAIVEVRCDDCGSWVDHAGPAADGSGWRCYGGYGGETCGDGEQARNGERDAATDDYLPGGFGGN